MLILTQRERKVVMYQQSTLVAELICLLRHFGARPALYIQPVDVQNARSFLGGVGFCVQVVTRPFTRDEMDAVVVSRGWRVGSGSRPEALESQMRERGMADAEIIAELAEIEAVTLERRLATTWTRGDLVELDGLLGAVVGAECDPEVPGDHIAVWFGEPWCERKSRGGAAGNQPEVWTVPAEHVVAAAPPVWKH